MISFYDMWLRIDELTKVSQIDSSGVELKSHRRQFDEVEARDECAEKVFMSKGGGHLDSKDYKKINLCVNSRKKKWESMKSDIYTYEFEHDFDRFDVEMKKSPVTAFGKTWEDVWDVSFSKNDSMSLTGTSGSSGMAIYGKVLSAVKKLLDTEKVDGLTFTGAHVYMDIMYDRFLKTFGGFKPVGSGVYIRDELVNDLEPVHADYVTNVAGKEHDDRIKTLKSSKLKFRDLVSSKKSIIGKVTGLSSFEYGGKVVPAIVRDIKQGEISLITKSPEGYYRWETVDMEDLSQIKSPKVLAPKDVTDMVNFFKTPGSQLNAELSRLGIPFDGSTYDFGF